MACITLSWPVPDHKDIQFNILCNIDYNGATLYNALPWLWDIQFHMYYVPTILPVSSDTRVICTITTRLHQAFHHVNGPSTRSIQFHSNSNGQDSAAAFILLHSTLSRMLIIVFSTLSLTSSSVSLSLQQNSRNAIALFLWTLNNGFFLQFHNLISAGASL